MKKNLIFVLLACTLLASNLFAQNNHCGSDQVYQNHLQMHPELAQLRESFNKQLEAGIKNINLNEARKTASSSDGNFWYDIPIVVHVIHDYGIENMTDNDIYNALNDPIQGWNITYAGANPDTADVIAPFKKWIGNAHMRLHLAVKDPQGNPTNGITRHRSYLTYNATDQSKLDDWPNSSYVNIWFTNGLAPTAGGFQPAAYAYFPETGSVEPYYDGVISFYSYALNDHTINHEMGHVMSLYHPWGNNNSCGIDCSGDDLVDDTPPTQGHCDCTHLYDSICSYNYFKTYPSILHPGTDSLVRYPDTTNVQNIMDYSYCSKMFTIGQTVRMHAALNNSLAFRNNLWNPNNLVVTGVWQDTLGTVTPKPDIPATPAFSSWSYYGNYTDNFVVPNNLTGNAASLKFIDESWNDTITSVRWQFTNGAKHSDTTIHGQGFNFYNSFSQPGWVNITMTASGNHTTPTTQTFNNAVFVAAQKGVDATSYFGEFNPSGDLNSYPTFNYYNNEFSWQPFTGAGFYDNYCMKYNGYDYRVNSSTFTYNYTGMPKGDYDDMYTVPFDLSGFAGSGNCNLNFYYSGATRTSLGENQTDSLAIWYSTDYTSSWHPLHTMKNGELANKGALEIAYAPLYQGDWATKTIAIPASARTPYTLFRFRYYPGICVNCPFNVPVSTGNNFYIDRLNVSPYTAEVANLNTTNNDVIIAPNPTTGSAFVILNGNASNTVTLKVTDITGKVVYTTTEQISAGEVRVEIPQSAITIKGLYIVETITGSKTNTQKLVVN